MWPFLDQEGAYFSYDFISLALPHFVISFEQKRLTPIKNLPSHFIEKDHAYNIYQFLWPEVVPLSSHHEQKLS